MLRSRALLLLALLSFSCATAAGKRRAELIRNLDQARISRSPAEIWQEVAKVLHERGYPLVGEDPKLVGLPSQGMVGKLFSAGYETRVRGDGSRVLETGTASSSAGKIKIRAEALAVPGGGTQLRITSCKQSEMVATDYSEDRDEELELAILERVEPALAARVRGEAGPAAAGAGAGADGWAPVRHLVGTWTGALPGGTAVRWTFGFAGNGQFVELKGTPLLFAGPTAGAGAAEELGRISRDAAGKLTWRQFTSGGQVDQYQPAPGLPGALVFTAAAPESLPGGRVRLTLGSDGEDELLAILELAEAGKELAVAGEVRLHRVKAAP